jgi:hypothetical protein
MELAKMIGLASGALEEQAHGSRLAGPSGACAAAERATTR